MKIKELYERSGIARNTIRYYEEEGLLSPAARSASGYREYTMTHVDELLFIKRCKHLQIPQHQVRELVNARHTQQQNHSDLSAILQQHLTTIDAQMANLKHLKKDLEQILASCDGDHSNEHCELLTAVAKTCT